MHMRYNTVKRGDIYMANLDPVIGSEQGGCRPVIILQNDIGNRHSPTTIVEDCYDIICGLDHKDYSDYQSDIIDALKEKPNSFFGPATVPHITRMYNANATQISGLLDELEKTKKISPMFKSQITGGNYAAKAVDRR